MKTVASRDLRNHTATVLAEVGAGSPVAVTVHGEVVAELHPPSRLRPDYVLRSDLVRFLEQRRADPALADLLEEISGGTTDDLDPLR
ncbi:MULTISPECIES: type II toxin-antitoxin system Phd/YefM family antitoxin [unclassified Nocardioides]|uniref:type II toxin-antitoxin system Phd/YefM family antitoxin n=1 Tax=unclassified Nocardioides TaxID=2615069 RepID=UPI000703B6CC|nr:MULTISPECIES: type II toxin-antitoxin system prevent-host-death family antitoxin [unclassified Nocardioides]KRC55029.1 hypothetical protein ASE19_06195 [Nocardioides sp. Root79]KRC72026.1 hypothetical protein ASE20_05060 [Nocardioides sp. Root240]